MESAPMKSAASGPGKPASHRGWFAGGRRLGLGVLLAFTVKGIFTTALMVVTLAAASLEEGHDALLPLYLVVWLAVGIGAYAVLGGANRASPSERSSSTRDGNGGVAPFSILLLWSRSETARQLKTLQSAVRPSRATRQPVPAPVPVR